MASQRQGRSGSSRNNGGKSQQRHRDNEGMMPVLAQAVRDVERAVQRNEITTGLGTKFQVTAMLAREERARLKADTTLTEAQRDGQLKRVEGIATILAKTATQQPSLFHLLDESAELSDAGRRLKREMQQQAGFEPAPEPEPDDTTAVRQDRQVTPQSVRRRQMANPFQPPDYDAAYPPLPAERRLVGWELIEPLLNAFEHAQPGAPSSMELPEPGSSHITADQELMGHQSRVIAAAAKGHRSFLLADEPGLGKTAQALLAAQATDAFPLLCIVPNVVKTSWAREAQTWIPERRVTVIHGDGEDMDGFADVVVVNYEILDRHSAWMGRHGFRGVVVDEAHFIKNKKSQRSRHVLEIADRVRERTGRPLMMALTGTPLINDIEDFRAIWEFLGWIDEKKPRPELMAELEELGLTPADHAFYPQARQAVVDMGIVRRRKVDVASDIPARRIADMPVELDEATTRSLRDAERELARRLLGRYDAARQARRQREEQVEGIDHDLVRRVAGWELGDDTDDSTGENVFSMVRRIGQAKVGLAADYAAQLAHSTGKVVFFAKHIDVMDAAAEVFADRGIGYATVRGDQTSTQRQQQIDAFTNDPTVQVIICSLTAAGVGINLQVASNVVLAELSWTDAEQTQAIDRVHRIGQTEPVTAWRIIASQTVDARIAELLDSKAGLASRALDGAEEEAMSSADVQLEAMVVLLTQALQARGDDQPSS